MPELKSPTPSAKRKSFAETLALLGYGDFEQEATDELNELVHAVTETGKSGSLKLELKLKPVGKGSQIEISNELKLTKPKPVREVQILFATADNNLQREDPRQKTLDGVRTVADEQKTLRTVGGAAS